jgi:phenylalanyl-tRNA synthetase beta chain
VRLTLGWLQEFVTIDRPIAALSERLVMAGFEVAAIDDVGVVHPRVVVGALRAVMPHPSSDRLQCCRVEVAAGEIIELVSGAPGLAAGQRVAVALPGATVAGGRQVETSTLRGVVSTGMLCSEAELELTDDADGVLMFGPEIALGTAVGAVPGVRDTVVEIEVGPNRGDCLSVQGLAREIAVLTGGRYRVPRARARDAGRAAAADIAVAVDAPDLCPLYTARIVRGVTVGRSPLWLRLRLRRAGMRSINTVVDATNHVMLERGQPLHAFDLERLAGKRVVARRAGAGESIVTLDGVARTLDGDDLVIADGEHPVAIAGVMGGQDSEITTHSQVVLLESAFFAPTTVRRTVRRLGLPSQASYRFERRVDPAGVELALDATAALLARIAGGRVAPGVVQAGPGTKDWLLPPVRLRPRRAIALLGTALSRAEMARGLRQTGGRVRADGDTLVLTPPSWRSDLRIEADLVEELARLGGYDAVPTVLPDAAVTSGQHHPGRRFASRLRRLLAGQGLAEMVTVAFTDERTNDALSGWVTRDLAPLAVRNPLSSEMGVLRRSPLAGLVRALRLNRAQGLAGVAAFEIGKGFGRDANHAPHERRVLALLLAGEWPPKGALASLCAGLEIASDRVSTVRTAEVGFLHPGKAALLRLDHTPVGVLGALHPEAMQALDLTGEVLVGELDFDALSHYLPRRFAIRPIPRFPAVARDIAVIADEEFEAGSIVDAIQALGDGRIESIRLFDCYRGQPIADGKKSLAYTIAYRASDRTLTDEEVNVLHAEVRAHLAQRFAVELRS